MQKYLEFIKESNDNINWLLDIEDIKQLFYGLTDEGWIVSISEGFYSGFDKITYNLFPNTKINLAYEIQIIPTKKYKSDDVTDDLLFAVSMLGEKLRSGSGYLFPTILVIDSDGDRIDLDRNTLILKGGIFLNDEKIEYNDDTIDEFIEYEYLTLIPIQPNKIKLTEKQVADYYNWDYDRSDKDGNIYLHFSLDELVNFFCKSDDSYAKILTDRDLLDYYNSSNYNPDANSMFEYILNNENSELLIRCIVKESGGWDEFIKELILDDEYENIEDLLKVRKQLRGFYRQLQSLYSEIYEEINTLIGDYEMFAHVESNYNSIVEEFDQLLGDYFTFNKIIKEEDNYYITRDDDNKEIKNHYKSEKTYYEISFSEDWLHYIANEDEFFTEFSLLNIFEEFGGNEIYYFNLDPHFSDYGDVDNVALNKEITAILSKYLKN